MMRSRLRGLLVATLACSSALAWAHPIGTVFSSPVDGDVAAMYWNPAAMSLSQTSRVDVVANVTIPQLTYQRSGIDTAQTNQPFPAVSLVSARPEPVLGIIVDRLWHKHLRLGLAVTVPSAAGAGFPETVTQNGQQILGPTRYHALAATVFDVFTQVGASFIVHRTLSIGVALNVVTTYLSVEKHIDLANQSAITDGLHLPCAQNPLGCENPALSIPLTLNGTGVSVGGSVGVLWQPISRLRIGASYVSPVKVPVKTTVAVDGTKLSDFAKQFLPGFGTLALNGSADTSVTVPQRVHFAVAFDVTPRVELMAMARWTNYSATEIISGIVTEKNSTLIPDSLKIPAVHNDEWMATLRVVGRIKERTRLGFSVEYVTQTVPDAYMTPSNLDFNELSLNLGVNVRVTRRVFLGASFSQTIVFSRTITQSAFANDAPAPYNLPDPSGTYVANAEKVGLDFSYRF